MQNSEPHSDRIIWLKNEANDETDASQLLDLAASRILTLLEAMELLSWSEEVEKSSWTLPHLPSHRATSEYRETEAIRFGHSYLYRTEFGHMNVWAFATVIPPNNNLVQISRDTEFLPLVGLCLQSLLQYFTEKVLQVDRVSAIVKKS